MGFGVNPGKSKRDNRPSLELIHRLECKVCPLNKIEGNRNPHMLPTGSNKPDVYIIGEAPGATEDKLNEQFVGASGKILRDKIPTKWLKRIRFNNVVRTRPIDNETPQYLEIEACRPSIQRDIKATKPKAIFGMGTIPLKWAIDTSSGIFEWRGRRFPINIDGYECWFYPMVHPAYILRRRGKWVKDDIGSEDERAFKFDILNALEEIDSLPVADVHDKKVAEYGVDILTGKPGDLKKLRSYLAWAAKQEEVGVDYETNALRPYTKNAKILTIAVGTHETSFAFAYRHKQSLWTSTQLKEVKQLWIEFLENSKTKAVANLPFEHEWTGYFFGDDLLRISPWECTLTQASVIDSRTGQKGKGKKHRKQGGPLSLGFLTTQYFGINIKTITKDLNKKGLDDEPIADVLRYNAIDAKYHCLLYQAQKARLLYLGLQKQYKSRLRRVPTCVLTQMKGMPIDLDESDRLEAKYNDAIKDAEDGIASLKVVKQFEREYGHVFNPESNTDVEEMFRNVLKRKEGLTTIEYNGKVVEKYSVDENVLNKIDHPLSPLIISLRKEHKKSTYVYKSIIFPDGKLHPIFNPGFFTETGRLSSEDPNAQNMPKRNEEAKEIRKQLRPPPGHSAVSFDYGQIEHRVFGMASKDKFTCDQLWDKFDVHGYWGAELASAYPSRIGGKAFLKDAKVMKAFRNDPIKSGWTFALFFGARLETCAEYCKIPIEYLKPLHDKFRSMYKGVFKWQETLRDFYQEHGYVELLTGHRRPAPLSWNQIINTPIQGTACEIVMNAMNRLSEHADTTGDMNYQPNAQIHDDLTFFWPNKKIDYYAEKVLEIMLSVPFKFINVPLVVEMSVGPDLYNMQEVLKASSDDWWGDASVTKKAETV